MGIMEAWMSVKSGWCELSHSDEENSHAHTEEMNDRDSGENDTVVATAYVPAAQYQRWENEAEARSQSISSLIASMVEAGLNDVQFEEESPNEIIELRQRLHKIRDERDDLRQELEAHQSQEYEVGLGKVKELIIENPGIDRREIMNHVASNPIVFVDDVLESLESSSYRRVDGEWYPPKELGGEA